MAAPEVPTPNGWRATTLGESCIMYQPKTISRKEMDAAGKSPVYGANGIIGLHNEFNHEESELVIGCRGSIGMVHITEPKSWINGNAMVIQSKKGEISQAFLRYLFLGGIDLSSAISGTAQPQITRKSLTPVEFSFPIDQKEQQRIVNILDGAFDQVGNKIAQTKQKLHSGKELFQSVLATNFSPIGEGWMEKSLGDFCEIYQPKTISRKQMVEDGDYPVFGANGVIGRYKEYNHENSELLITCRGATCGSVNISLPRSWITGNAMVVRPDETLVLRRFLEYAFQGPIDLSAVITGSAQPQITRTNLSPVRFVFPSLSEQQRIVENLDSISQNVALLEENLSCEIESLHDLKQSMLKKHLVDARES